MCNMSIVGNEWMYRDGMNVEEVQTNVVEKLSSSATKNCYLI